MKRYVTFFLIGIALVIETSRVRTGRAQSLPPPPRLPAPAPSSTALTLNDVLRSLSESYPLLRAAEIERVLAEADLLSAEGGFDVSWKTRASVTPFGYYDMKTLETVIEQPTALWGSTFFGGYRLGRGNYPPYYGERETLSLGEVRAGVVVPLWRDGPIDRRRAGIRRAEAGRRLADATVAQQRIDIARVATTRYWDWVAAGKRVAVFRTLLALAVSRDAGLGTRVERGDLPAFERTDNARTILQRQSQVVSAERSLQQTAFELSLYLRQPDGRVIVPEPARLPESFPEPISRSGDDIRDAVEKAVIRRPDVRRLDALRRQTSTDLEVAKNQTSPSVDARVTVSRDLGEGIVTLRPTIVEAGLLLDIPLQARVATGRAHAAEAQLNRLRFQEQFIRDRIATDVRDALSSVEASRQRVEVARREVDLARQLEQGERSRFDLGDSTVLFVNLREQAMADAALREIDALADYQRAQVTLRAAGGENLTSNASVVPAPGSR